MASRNLLKLKRVAEVVGILAEHDFLAIMRRIARAPVQQVAGGKLEIQIPEDVPRRVRLLMEDLGPTYIKMGQLLATRPDLLPKAFVDEFRHFYDRTRPSPFPEVRALVEQDLGRPLEQVFATFDEQPIASASIGQVHAATLLTGEKVAVKVQHPGTAELVRIDFEVMRPLVRFIQNLFAASRLFQPSEHLHEIEEMLARELDYTHEARILQRFYRNFEGHPSVKIPKLHIAHSSRRVLVMEFIEGLPLSQATGEEMARRAIDRRRVAQVLTEAMAKMIFEDRVFHADPSPGNLIITGPAQVAFIDFGAVGHVTRRRAERVMHLVHGFETENTDEVVQALLELCNIHGPVDHNQLRRDVERIMDYAVTERAAVGDPVIMDLIAKTAEHNHMLLPADFFLVSRALFQFEGMCVRLDPEYDIVAQFTPVVLRHMYREAMSEEGLAALKEPAQAYAELLATAPTRLNSLLRKLEMNQLEVRIQNTSADGAARDERRTMQRSFTALVGALIVGAGVTSLSAQPEATSNFLFFGALFTLLWGIVMLYYSE